VATLETAHFRGDDADVLVAASLACPGCLSSDVRWTLDAESFDPSVEVSCERCGHRRRVFLEPMQELRLALHEDRPLRQDMPTVPPPGVAL
jgi:hypothetical protein